jgi:uncharacterized protein
MELKEQINKDLKTAMLAGEKNKVMTLRGLKSAILYAEVAEGKRDSGISNDEVIKLLQKEAKKRQESADLYHQGNNLDKAEHEEVEKLIIESYLPVQISEEEIRSIVLSVIKDMGNVSMQQMGQIIGSVKKKCGGSADGSIIAKIVKEQLAE